MASAPSPPAANRAVCILRLSTVARRLFRSLKLKSSCEVRLTCSALHAALDPLLLAREVVLFRKLAVLPNLPAFRRLLSLSVEDGVPKAHLQDFLRGLQHLGTTLEVLKLHLKCRVSGAELLRPLPRLRSLSVRLEEVELTLLGGAGLTSLLLSDGFFLRDYLPKIAHSLKRLGGLRTLRFDVTRIKGGWESLFGTIWTAIEPPIRARLGSRLEHFALRESGREPEGVPDSEDGPKRCVLSHAGWEPDIGFSSLRRTTLTEPKDAPLLLGCRETLETLKLRVVMDRVPSLAPFAHLRRLYLQLTVQRFLDEEEFFMNTGDDGTYQQMHGMSELVLHPELVNLDLESLAVELVGHPEWFGPRIALALPASLRHLSIRLNDPHAPPLAFMLGLSRSLKDTHRGIPGTKESDFDPGLRFRLKHDAPRLESLTMRQFPPSVVLDMLTTVPEPLTRLSFEQCTLGEWLQSVWLRAELAADGASSVAEAFRAWWAAEEDRLCRQWSRDLQQKRARKTKKSPASKEK